MKQILKWQYEQLIKELLLLQEHLSNPSCPCETAGEHCVRKHLFSIEAYAEETIPMEENGDLKIKLEELALQSASKREQEEKSLCGGGEKKKPVDWIIWARDWRKKFEDYSLACENLKKQMQK
ncbi:MAG: hypothetical protein ACM3OC_01440 [Deltaproteobacteria bacterium]